MKNPMPLYDCTCKLDACFLKNSIQRVSCISVEIIKNSDKLTLMVSEANLHKSKAILVNQLDFLPSTVAKHADVEQGDELIENRKGIKSERNDIEEPFFRLLNFNTLFMDFSFSGSYRL